MSNTYDNAVAKATKLLNDAKLASGLTSIGRAKASGLRASKSLVKAAADANRHPTFFLSPYDNNKRPEKDTRSTATPEQRDVMELCVADGYGKADKGGYFEFVGELFTMSAKQLDDIIATKVDAMKDAKDKGAKASYSKEVEALKISKANRTRVASGMSSTFRDIANQLITEYKRRAKAEAIKAKKADSTAIANEVAAKLKEETYGKKETKAKAEKSKAEVALQQAKNLYSQVGDDKAPSAEELNITSKQYRELLAILSAMVEPSH